MAVGKQPAGIGTMPDDMTRANMAAIAEEILPHFRDRLPLGTKQAAE